MADSLADRDGSHPEAPHLGLVYFAQFVFRVFQLFVIFVSFESEIVALIFEFQNAVSEFGTIILPSFWPNTIHGTRITCRNVGRLAGELLGTIAMFWEKGSAVMSSNVSEMVQMSMPEKDHSSSLVFRKMTEYSLMEFGSDPWQSNT